MAKKETSTEKNLTPIDLTQETLQGIADLQQRKNILSRELAAIGELKIIYSNREDQAKQYFNVNIELEKAIAKEIEDQYGRGRVDLEQGKFYPAE